MIVPVASRKCGLGRNARATSRTFDGSAQQGQKTASGCGTEQVDDRDKERERHVDIDTKERNFNGLKVLRSENNGCAREQNDYDQMEPSHGSVLHHVCILNPKSRPDRT